MRERVALLPDKGRCLFSLGNDEKMLVRSEERRYTDVAIKGMLGYLRRREV
jgi:hypothetical protein